MADIPTPTPMPTTGFPDQLGTNPPTDMIMHGTKLGAMSVNPGRPPTRKLEDRPQGPKT